MIPKQAVSYMHAPDTEYQCDDCPAFIAKYNQCTFHGQMDVILKVDTCNYFMKWPANTFGFIPIGALTKDVSGWARNEEGYSCKRCDNFIAATFDCVAVDKDSLGDDPGMIHPNACCNGWKPCPRRSLMTSEALMLELANGE